MLPASCANYKKVCHVPMSPLTIRPYDPQRDEAWAYALWQRTLGQRWPLSRPTFHHVTVANAAHQPGDHAVAQIGVRRVGFVASQVRQIPGEQAPVGQLTMILVEPRYQQVMLGGGYADVVVARDRREGIVGTSSVMDSRTMGHTFVWEQLLAAPLGAVGPLGVAEHVRGNGIGLALAARVTERLHERGVATSYIGWTWLVGWYGRLGYQTWQTYTMSWKQLRTV